MSQYSETIGSFTRTGNYPLEANYIFSSETALKDFYNDPLNQTTLHKGLLKVVEDDGTGNQALYWVTKKQTNDELEFVKLISNLSIENIDTQLKDLLEKLNQEIEDRKLADQAIWGTTDSTNVPEDLNSLLDLANAIKELREKSNEIDSLRDQLKATVGTLDNDIITYLSTLPYTSLTEIANTLHKFLTEVDSTDTTINTFKELQNFLEGYEDTQKLVNVLQELLNTIYGTPIPTEQFSTLRGIEEFVTSLANSITHTTDNIQKELDQTQTGVGLDGSGSFSPDKETHYLADATSVMNALKTLDELIYTSMVTNNLQHKNGDDVVDIYVTKQIDGFIISAKLLLSNVLGNQLTKKSDGLYFNVKEEYSNGVLTLKVNDNIISQNNIAISGIVDTARYDTTSESLIIIFNRQDGTTETVTIPVGALIREWVVDNQHPDRVVELYREEVVDGADKLSGDVRISTNLNNILEKDGNTLLVKGTSDNITHDGQNLDTVISNIQQAFVWHNVV